jgi:hypothetical protein
MNVGYADEVVEAVWLTVTQPEAGYTIECMPTLELDVLKFLQGKREIHGENMLGPFQPFPVGGKQTVSKCFVFYPKPGAPGTKPILVVPGRHHFTLSVRTAGNTSHRPMLTTGRNLDANAVKDYLAGLTVWLSA